MKADRRALIIALARTGASSRAWAEFVAAGYDKTDEPSCLALRGRLLKDRAALATRQERRSLYRDAASSYAQAASTGATYPLINAATLFLLAEDRAASAAHAAHVLERIQADPGEPETPYWRAATQAEALLLLDREGEARSAFAEAVALAPEAWEDHASTLRQFGLILEAQGRDPVWLDSHRPPRSVHFGGHMSFDARVVRREHLDEKIAAALEEEKVGFGYGALAAGADIIVAEALLACGAELHAVLPGGAEAFASVSVDPFGKGWRRRFDSVLGRAATVRSVRPVGTPPDATMIGLADEIAMGAAVMNARRLESSALQLLVQPPEEAESGPANSHARWAEAGWRRRIVPAPREAVGGGPVRLPAAAHGRLAILAVRVDGEILEAVAEALRASGPAALGPYFTGGEVIVGYGEAAEAARAASEIAGGAGGAGIGGHYGVADPLRDPFSSDARLGGEPAALAMAAAASAPAGTVCVTGDFAAALAASGAKDLWTELVGELEASGGGEPVELHAVKARS